MLSRSKKEMDNLKNRLKNPSSHISIKVDLLENNAIKLAIKKAKKFLKQIDIVLHVAGGGFGEISELQEGYEAGGGGRVSAEAIHYWEVFGTLRWGILCIHMAFTHINGPHASFEKAVIGRRTAETEYDLLQIID